MEFDGVSLLRRNSQILCAHGVSNISIVVGFMKEAIIKEVSDFDIQINIVENSDYELGSILSLWHARESLNGPTLLMDADVLFDSSILTHITGNLSCCCIAADRSSIYTGEEMIVEVSEGQAKRLVRGLDVVAPSWSGESIGIFRACQEGTGLLLEELAKYISVNHLSLRGDWEDVVSALLCRHTCAVVDVTGAPWIEIDTDADLELAKRMTLPKLKVP